MALSKTKINEIVKEFGTNEKDTGSTAVQIALLSAQIRELTEHMKVHKHDYHSQRGLLRLVGQRRGLLDYFNRVDREGYLELIAKLGIRR
ncbi:MAG: 30S ribosomal protein S15 [Bacilli bacterium]